MINIGTDNIRNLVVGETQVQKVCLGDTVIWNHYGLPEGYTELEYIKSTEQGSQYIDLNIMLYDVLNKNYDIAFKTLLIGRGSDYTTQGTLFGCQNATNPWPGTFVRLSGSMIIGRYIGGSDKDNTLGLTGTVDDKIIELPVQTAPNKNVYNLNNSGLTHRFGTSLFCAFSDENKTPYRFVEAKLYYFKLFVEGELVRDLVACKNPNDVVGMYDLVNNVFYSSPNGAAFEAGPIVSNNN